MEALLQIWPGLASFITGSPLLDYHQTTIETWLALLACLLLSSYVQNLTGFAFGLVFLGLVSSFNLLSISLTSQAISYMMLVQAVLIWRQPQEPIEPRLWRPILPSMILGIVLGLLVLTWADTYALSPLRKLLGLTIIATALMLVTQQKSLAQFSPPFMLAFAGLAAGLLGGLFATAGPPLVYALYRQPLSLARIRHLLTLLFGISQCIRIMLILIQGQGRLDALLLALIALPLMWGVSHWVHKHPLSLERSTMTRTVALLLVLSGLGLLI